MRLWSMYLPFQKIFPGTVLEPLQLLPRLASPPPPPPSMLPPTFLVLTAEEEEAEAEATALASIALY